jgi:putative beta-lysine N-acetyltransferase
MTTQTYDQMEELAGALIQHGPFNDRIYLMSIGSANPEILLTKLRQLAKDRGYSRIFAKIPEEQSQPFIAGGYKIEAKIPDFFSQGNAALFLGLPLTKRRAEEPNLAKLNEILEISQQRQSENSPAKPLDNSFVLRSCGKADVEVMASIYQAVFPTYPFPIHEPTYLLDTMKTHIQYHGVESAGKLIALSSAEMNVASSSAEMTDFATLPDFRGHGLAQHLLTKMEKSMAEQNIKTPFTIARAMSPGMNITFAKMGYKYAGRLLRNTNISGNIETMNVWYKKL